MAKGAWLAACATFALLGCEETVALGTECPPIGRLCLLGSDATPALDAGVGAGTDGGGQVGIDDPLFDAAAFAIDDGGIPLLAVDDAGFGAMGEAFPALRNPSFLITGGAAGGVTAVINVSVDVPAEIAPWEACQLVDLKVVPGLNFTAVTVARKVTYTNGVITPTEGDSFLSITFPDFVPTAIAEIPISQQLMSPLRAGVTYGFAMDVRTADPTTTHTVKVYGSNTRCGRDHKLASADVPAGDAWTTVCVRFTPTGNYTYLSLAAGSGALIQSPFTTPGLFIDNIRLATGCK